MHIIFPIILDGQTIRAMLDTGSPASMLSARAAKVRLGLSSELDATPDGSTRFAMGQSLPFHRHRFSTMDIGGITFRNTELNVVSDDHVTTEYNNRIPNSHVAEHNENVTEMTLGFHHLSKMRFYIAYGEKVLYVSPADAR